MLSIFYLNIKDNHMKIALIVKSYALHLILKAKVNIQFKSVKQKKITLVIAFKKDAKSLKLPNNLL